MRKTNKTEQQHAHVEIKKQQTRKRHIGTMIYKTERTTIYETTCKKQFKRTKENNKL